jgi:hypothetical protein
MHRKVIGMLLGGQGAASSLGSMVRNMLGQPAAAAATAAVKLFSMVAAGCAVCRRAISLYCNDRTPMTVLEWLFCFAGWQWRRDGMY